MRKAMLLWFDAETAQEAELCQVRRRGLRCVWNFGNIFRALEWKTPIFYWIAGPETPNALYVALHG